MTKKPLFISLVIAGSLFATSSFACPERGEGGKHRKGHDNGHTEARYERGIKRLGLTDEQKTAIQAIREAAKPEREALMGQMKESQRAIRQLQHDSARHPDAVRSALLAQVDLKIALMDHGKNTRHAIHAQLTPEQQAQWQARVEERRHHYKSTPQHNAN